MLLKKVVVNEQLISYPAARLDLKQSMSLFVTAKGYLAL